MHESVQEREIIPNLKDAVLISAFANASKGGTTAASALTYLAQQWNAHALTEFEAEECYTYTHIRRQVVYNDGKPSLHWPSNVVYLANPEGAERSYLLLVGVEPNLGWRGFLRMVEGFCRRLGVTTAVTLHSTPAAVSHRQEVPVQAIYGSEALQPRFGVPQTLLAEGPVDFGAALSLHLQSQGFQTVDLIALEPFYTPGMPDASAGLALIKVIDGAYGMRTEITQLEEAATSQRELLENAVAASEDLTRVVEALESRDHDPMLLCQPPDETGAWPGLTVDDVMDEVNRILET
jgi:predicted ATP-grasp superfamily ATP-dependent carboligase